MDCRGQTLSATEPVGLVVAWACATANVADNTFQGLIRQYEERMIVLSDTAFHAAEGDPTNLKLCQRTVSLYRKGVALLLQRLKPWFSSLLFCPVLSSVFSS